MNKPIKWACGGSIACFLAASTPACLYAEDTNTLMPETDYQIESAPQVPHRFWPIFGSEFLAKAQPELIDQFGFPALPSIIHREESEGSRIFADFGSQAKSSLNHVLQDSLQEAALRYWDMTIDDMEDWGEGHIPFVEGLLEGSIGNTEEQDLEPVSASYSATAWQWLTSVHDDGPVRYGLRPFNVSPYLYISPKNDIWQGHVIISDFRWYYDIENGHHRVTGTVAFPIGHYQLIGGFSGNPLHLSPNDQNPPSASLQFTREIGSHFLVDVFSVGISDSFNGYGPAFGMSFSKRF